MSRRKEEEFEQIYRSMFPKMMSFAGTFCRDKDEAEDVTQDAFLKAFAAFGDCRDAAHLGNWLRKIVYRTFLDHKRLEKRRIKECVCFGPEQELTVEDHPDPAQNAEELLLAKQFDPELERAIADLDQDARELLSLVYVQGESHPEAARKLGIASPSSRSRAHRLCAKIRRNLGRDFWTTRPT